MSFDGEGLRTQRLILRRWCPEDAAPMTAVNSDPVVTEFLNRRMDAAATATFLDRTQAHWAEHGFGHWAVEPLDGPLTGEMIGFVGVAYPTYLPEMAAFPELGWRLSPSSWGSGYATETALAARDDAFDRLRLPVLISLIHPENTRSQRVAEKLGMTIERQVFNPVHDREIDVWQALAP